MNRFHATKTHSIASTPIASFDQWTSRLPEAALSAPILCCIGCKLVQQQGHGLSLFGPQWDRRAVGVYMGPLGAGIGRKLLIEQGAEVDRFPMLRGEKCVGPRERADAVLDLFAECAHVYRSSQSAGDTIQS